MTEVSSQGLVAALARAQAKFPPIVKSHTNPAFKGSQYADVADVLAAVRPVLAAEGIVVTQSTNDGEDGVYLTTSLRYGDERIDSYFPLHVAGLNPQQVGSLLTYHRRYQLCALLGVHPIGDDDDGNAASVAPPPQEAAHVEDHRGHLRELIKGLGESKQATVKAWMRNNQVPALTKPGATAGQLDELHEFIDGLDAEPFEVSPLAASDGVGDEMEGGLPATTPPPSPTPPPPNQGDEVGRKIVTHDAPANPARVAREHLSGTERMARNSAARTERTMQ